MTEILFYHLTRQPLEAVLPTLLRKSLERGWRALVRATTPERVSALDDHLWTFAEDSFLPHGTDREPDPETQPVVIGSGEGNTNAAHALFLVEGAAIPADAQSYERIMLLFDGGDEEALVAARVQWKQVSAAGHAVSYWQQDQAGRWQKKA